MVIVQLPQRVLIPAREAFKRRAIPASRHACADDRPESPHTELRASRAVRLHSQRLLQTDSGVGQMRGATSTGGLLHSGVGE